VAGLTEKQKRFVDEYIIDANATQSAIRAGYSKRTAYSIGVENLRKPEVESAIEARLEEIRTQKTATAQEVMEYLSSVMRGESKSEIVVVESMGNGEGSQAVHVDKYPDEKERLKAAELLGKRFGIFTEKVDVRGDMELIVKIDYGDDAHDD